MVAIVTIAATNSSGRNVPFEDCAAADLAAALARGAVTVAQAHNAPEPVRQALGGLAPGARFDTTRDLWLTLGLQVAQRF